MLYSSAHQKLFSTQVAIRRKGWNAPGQFVFLINGHSLVNTELLAKHGIKKGTKVKPVLALFTAQGEIQPGWLPSQGDLQGDDWEIVPGPTPVKKEVDALPETKSSRAKTKVAQAKKK